MPRVAEVGSALELQAGFPKPLLKTTQVSYTREDCSLQLGFKG